MTQRGLHLLDRLRVLPVALRDVKALTGIPYVVEYELATVPQLDPATLSSFKGLVLSEVLQSSRTDAIRLITHWSEVSTFLPQQALFESTFALGVPIYSGHAIRQEWKEVPWWRPSTLSAWILFAASLVAAGGGLWTFWERAVAGAEPLADARSNRVDVRANQRFEAPFSIGNLSRTSGVVEIESAVLNSNPPKTFQVQWRKAYVDEGAYKDNSVSGTIARPGDYLLSVRGHMSAGVIRGSKAFSVTLPVKVWRSGFATSSASVLDADPGTQTCRLQQFLDTGSDAKGADCVATLAPAADLRFTENPASAPELYRYDPPAAASIPGRESSTVELHFRPMREFTTRRVEFTLRGSIPRTADQCATFAEHLDLACSEGEGR